MRESLKWYIKRSKSIIRSEGLLVFLKKVQKTLRNSFNVCKIKYEIKILSKLYIRGFHEVLYYSAFTSNNWLNTNWLGTRVIKCPFDLWIYQEIIYQTKPEVIIETGTSYGGSALFLASICDLIDKGEIITIDIKKCAMSHPRVTKITGNSISEDVINQVKKIVGKRKCMVILDSDHIKDHVLKEMQLYHSFVSVGNYLIVEDTNINGHPVLPDYGPGPMEAVAEFVRANDNFTLDKSKEKFYLTFNPNGYLLRIK